MKEREAVFHYGDHGDTFYIILKGSVSVLIPHKKYETKFKKGKINGEVIQN